MAGDPSKARPRVLIFSGKGGVGKTTIAAATGLRAAEDGHRTIIISVDVAHSLADAFDVTERLLEHPRGTPYQVTDKLHIQEVDIQEEVQRHWEEVFGYFSALFRQTGLNDVMAEEIAFIPGMEDVIALLYLNEYVQDERYDTIILDLAPTGESLRFVSMPGTIDWYMRKVYRFERNLARLARPLTKKMSDIPIPEESYFKEIQNLWKRLDGVDELLTDAQRTSVRLVTNAERMVVRETERAHLYFALHGVRVDHVIVNRILDPANDVPDWLQGWARTHRDNLQRIHDTFTTIPISVVPLQGDEVVGLDRLRHVADILYGTDADRQDPAAPTDVGPPFSFTPDPDGTTLRLYLPGARRDQIDVLREAESVIVRIGSQKRHILLPRRLRGRAPTKVHYDGTNLVVRFTTDAA